MSVFRAKDNRFWWWSSWVSQLVGSRRGKMIAVALVIVIVVWAAFPAFMYRPIGKYALATVLSLTAKKDRPDFPYGSFTITLQNKGAWPIFIRHAWWVSPFSWEGGRGPPEEFILPPFGSYGFGLDVMPSTTMPLPGIAGVTFTAEATMLYIADEVYLTVPAYHFQT